MSDTHDPEFTTTIQKGYPGPEFAVRPTSKLSIASLISGILGITVLPIIGGIVAIATGHAALREIRESKDWIDGKGMARVGLGLGYAQIVLAVIAVIIVILVFSLVVPAAVNTLNSPAVQEPLIKLMNSRGVKMVNEMTAEEFELIAENKIEVKNEEILACYYSGFEMTEPEFALLTKSKLIYLKEGRKTEFDLKDVTSLKDDRAYELAYLTKNIGGALQTSADQEIYHIEVQSKDGPRMRIEIKPEKDGPLYFDALKKAVEAAGGNTGIEN